MDVSKTLTIPLYTLLFVKNAETFDPYISTFTTFFKTHYSQEEQQEIIAALNWAKEHPETDFRSVLPGLSMDNKNLYACLLKIHDALIVQSK